MKDDSSLSGIVWHNLNRQRPIFQEFLGGSWDLVAKDINRVTTTSYNSPARVISLYPYFLSPMVLQAGCGVFVGT